MAHILWPPDVESWLIEKTLMLGRIEGRGDGADRGWDGWMASPTQWTWVWVDSGCWWWTGRPGVLQFMGSQRVRHDWATELNWTEWLKMLDNFPCAYFPLAHPFLSEILRILLIFKLNCFFCFCVCVCMCLCFKQLHIRIPLCTLGSSPLLGAFLCHWSHFKINGFTLGSVHLIDVFLLILTSVTSLRTYA